MAHRVGPAAHQPGALLHQRRPPQDEGAAGGSPLAASCRRLLTLAVATPPPQGFQQDITLNADRIDALILAGEQLIQKSCPPDAALMEDELEELHNYCQEVFRRVERFHHRLLGRTVSAPHTHTHTYTHTPIDLIRFSCFIKQDFYCLL